MKRVADANLGLDVASHLRQGGRHVDDELEFWSERRAVPSHECHTKKVPSK